MSQESLMQTTFKMRDQDGNFTELPFHANEYQKAADAKLSLSQYLSQKYGAGTDEGKYGPVISQMMGSAGMYLGNDRATGLRSPSMKEIVSDGIQLSNLIRNDGTDRNTVAGRLLFPEIILRTMEANLTENHDDFIGGWNSMIAISETINGPIFDQPLINSSASENVRSNPISQLSMPNRMLSITTSNIPRRIATRSIGVQISDEAQAATSLQLVNLAVAAQSRGERVAMIEEDIDAILNGDLDRSTEGALPTFTAQSLDAAIVAAGTMTHLAYIKYLRSKYRVRSIDWVICDLATAIALEGRSGKPVASTNYNPNGSNLAVDLTIDNLAVRSPRILLVDDGVVPANTVVGIDSRYALRRVTNVSASYNAIEEFVLRRGTGFRIDYGEVTHRLYDQAFDVMTLTV